MLLASRTGYLVTRAEIAERLWDREVFVDTEHGINTAIRKIRQVLGDDSRAAPFLADSHRQGLSVYWGYRRGPPASGRGAESPIRLEER